MTTEPTKTELARVLEAPMNDVGIQAALVKSIIERWSAYQWTVQGFGFFRTKIQGVGRIHVWDDRVATPLVSTIHTHPWPFRSTVVSGELLNLRFHEHEVGELRYVRQKIKTGEGGGLVDEPSEVLLTHDAVEYYSDGHSYSQEAAEIHRSIAQPGTVTLIERPQGPPLEEAMVYWPRGTGWVSAEPKPAEAWELERAVKYALARWRLP